MTTTEEAKELPPCSCGRGPMKLLCAGPTALNPGRYFYRCPRNDSHPMSFIWWDQYDEVMSNARAAVSACSSVGIGTLVDNGARSRVNTHILLDDAVDSSQNEVHSSRNSPLNRNTPNPVFVWCICSFFILFFLLMLVLLGVVVGMLL